MTVFLASAGFLSGVAARSLVPIPATFIVFLGMLALAVLIAAFFLNGKKAALFFALILFGFALGAWRADGALQHVPTSLDLQIGKEVVLEGLISDEPDIREKSVLLTVSAKTLREGEEAISASGKVLAIMSAHTPAAYGDVVRITGTLLLPEAFETDTGRFFDYPGYLAVRGIGYSMVRPEMEAIGQGEGNAVLAALYGLKRVYLAGIAASLPEPHASLAGGITVGAKRGLGEQLLDDFRTTGIIHIVVLSGYNMTIIAETLLRILAFLPLRFALASGIFGIIGFALMTGAGASIVRASVMAILALIARAVGRTYVITRALLLAVVGMVAWNPLILLHDPGFQLSALATVGLVYVSPFIENRVPWIPEKFGLRAIVGATIGTQLTVLPLLLYQMGTLSFAALPVNLLILPLVPLSMFFSFIAALGGAAVPFLGPMIGFPAYILLSYAFLVVNIAAKVPLAAVSVPPFPAWLMLFAYAAMFAWLWRIYGKTERPTPGESAV